MTPGQKWYSEKRKDPRWQKKRLEVMERDGFTCQHCWSQTKTLNVHHKFYERGRDPWDYNQHVLITLCEECHQQEPGRLSEVIAALVPMLTARFSSEELYAIGMCIVNTERSVASRQIIDAIVHALVPMSIKAEQDAA